MWIAPTICYVLILLLSLLGIRYHINIFKYPVYLTLPLTLGIYIPLSIVFTLPLDYVSHNTQSTQEITWFGLPDTVILYIWKSNYWITFLLTWIILPVLLEFYRSGHHDAYSKLKDAIRENLKFQVIMISVSLVGLIYMLIEVGLNLNHLKLMIIAISHVYSLILATWLMGHGLISIPRNKWVQGSVVNDLNHHYLKLPKLVDDLEDVRISFREDVLKVIVLKQNYTSESIEDFKYRDWILNLYDSIPGEIREQVEKQYLHDTTTIDRDQLNDQFMTSLNSSFSSNLNRLIGYQSEFNRMISKILRLEDVLTAVSSRELIFRVDNHRVLWSPKFNFIYWYYLRPISNKIAAAVLGVASLVILQSEFFHSTKISLMNVFVYSTDIHNHSFLQFAISCIVFSYMLFAALHSLTQLKIFNMYHLVPRNSDPVSACWYAMYIARLTIPLSYNFITLFVSRDSIFEKWYGQSVHLTGLFNLLNNWIPRLILVPVLLAMFHVYDKVKKRLGFGDLYDSWILFDEDEEHNNDDSNKRSDLIIVEAKRIVSREMSRRQMHLRPFHLTNSSADNINNLNPADANYERRRREFNNTLANRIDNSPDEEPVYYDGTLNAPQGGIRGRIGQFFGGFFQRNEHSAPQRPYRDEPLDDFDYDHDANENLVL
ncbi:LMBR1-like membrane family protein [Candida parapsilosis]|uniref:Uncharacterized protein n=2 Tax=Candida parapsilosis TaxID=5480 RepID=G8BKC2_CANPC|nr:uncharacterized protein CPAR2_701990 [Candida parapsilosis]KAF6042238.1 LMBR1-like membrane family protein [Candida parapsilosis]KAF6042517.1 LMBR1-like membrane family protein [Candida parapsilosis]KAF6042962.1 LMBR1-like membrane family protein [Candida parapsilosis]KAF6058029.1 LMBR1-like membrane family protein [Candida parapsilosis]CAD1812712.1 unnamed protein product [Candida parapsilosis]